MSIIVETPFQNFTGLDGKPLTNGKVYIGQVGTDPTVPANQIPVFWDEALTIPAAQPLTTNAGYIVRFGTPARVWVATDYSISVKNASNILVYYIAQFGVVDISLYAKLSDLASSIGSSLIGFLQAGFGAVLRTSQDKMRDIICVKDFGAVGDGVANDIDAIEMAVAAAKPNQAILLCGVHRCLRKLQITKEVAFVGTDPRNANLPDFNNSSSCLLFSNVSDGGIIGDFNVSLSNMVVISFADFAVRLVDGSLMTNNVLLQGGVSASVSILRGYYNKFVNTRLEFSTGIGAIFDNCYNVSTTNLSVRGAPNCLSLLNGSTMTMNGGSLEDNNLNGYGVTLRAGSSINFFGTYFEGAVIGGVGGRCVSIGANCQVTAVGCQVYLSTFSQWLAAEDSGSTGIRVFSRNNNLVWPTGSFATEAYSLLSIDPTGSCDIAGDNWPNQGGGVPGPNCKYVGPLFTSGAGPIQNVGSYSIIYPPGNDFFGKNINTRPICTNTSNSTPSSPQPGVIVNFGNNGNPGDDPLNLHVTSYGYNSYQAVYQNGKWEKVGSRLSPQSDSVATTVVDLRSDFNTLLAKVRADGLMP